MGVRREEMLLRRVGGDAVIYVAVVVFGLLAGTLLALKAGLK